MTTNSPRPSSAGVSRRMIAQAERDTSTEMRLRRELHKKGLRYRLHRRLISGLRREVDIVFVTERVAVMVDGCFWHGCKHHGTVPKSNRDWWTEKIEQNRLRDADTDRRLIAEGWTVERVWEHEDPLVAANRVEQLVTARRARGMSCSRD
jgi:DNA mismatch endonuclease (patch repair protein)